MKRPTIARGLTLVEVAAVLLVVSLLLALTLPVLAGVRGGSMVGASLANLATIGQAHSLYAFDWGGRQVTYAVDDLASYGFDAATAVSNYGTAIGGDHPPIIAGNDLAGVQWGFYFTSVVQAGILQPIGFSGNEEGFGTFRIPTTRPLHEYLSGRFYDPSLFVPDDPVVWPLVEPLLDDPAEFQSIDIPGAVINHVLSGYVSSPAALYDPGVFRSNAQGGFQDPFSFDEGLNAPALAAVAYPSLKTHVLEHYWVRDQPALCNPVYDGAGNFTDGCEPYFFNHGIDAAPATLFYDGSTRLLPNSEALAADQTVLKNTRGLDGLWHRGTPFGANGYYIDAGFDGTPVSHHTLTTDGILGRDTLAGIAFKATAQAAPAPLHRSHSLGVALPSAAALEPEGSQP